MFVAISNCWALLLGIGLIMLGNGLQGSLLGIRASIEGFNLTITGLIMAGYYIGVIGGSTVVPKIVGRVGHIRTFGALAAIASASVLVHAVFIDPWVWWTMRVVTGFSYAGLFVVAESWLNDASENETRGKLLSFYMLISLGSMASGQLMLNISPPSGFGPFIMISVLVSLAVVPILVSVGKMPSFESAESVSIRQLFLVSPLGVVGMLVGSVAMGTIFGMGPIYASSIGLSVQEISFFMASIIAGGAVMQFPLGQMSDVFGRRLIIIGICLVGALASLFASHFSGSGWQLYAVIALVGGLSTPLYSLCVAHTNDYLSQPQNGRSQRYPGLGQRHRCRNGAAGDRLRHGTARFPGFFLFHCGIAWAGRHFRAVAQHAPRSYGAERPGRLRRHGADANQRRLQPGCGA
jgi:MFS family permease